MNNNTLYLCLQQSVLVGTRKINISDIATIFCSDKDISYTVGKIDIMTLPGNEESQVVITALKLIQLISRQHPHIHIETLGSSETIVYYKNLKANTVMKIKTKALFLMLLTLLGTAYSIMAYNQDVASNELLGNLYTLFTNSSPSKTNPGYFLGVLAYSIGLCIGMIIFFNHGVSRKNTDDPTPLQVQMRLYEQEVNQCIIIDNSRENKTIDAD